MVIKSAQGILQPLFSKTKRMSSNVILFECFKMLSDRISKWP